MQQCLSKPGSSSPDPGSGLCTASCFYCLELGPAALSCSGHFCSLIAGSLPRLHSVQCPPSLRGCPSPFPWRPSCDPMHSDKVPIQGQFQEPLQSVPTASCCCQSNTSQRGTHWPCLLGGLLLKGSQTSQMRKGSCDAGARYCHFLLLVPPGGQACDYWPLSPFCGTAGHCCSSLPSRGPGSPHTALGFLSIDATTDTWPALKSSSPRLTGKGGVTGRQLLRAAQRGWT